MREMTQGRNGVPLLLAVWCMLARQRVGIFCLSPRHWLESVYFLVWPRQGAFELCGMSKFTPPPLSFFPPSRLKWFAERRINMSCFYRCKTNRSNAACAWACEWGLCYVWRTPPHHLHLQTLCNLNLFVAFMLYWPPKVKERDLDLKHKSSLQALELSLPLNAADQCPFLLKIKPFWTLKAFHCWTVPKCHMGEWAEKSPFFP